MKRFSRPSPLERRKIRNYKMRLRRAKQKYPDEPEKWPKPYIYKVLMGKRLFEPDLKETANAVAAAAVAAAAAGVTESRSLPGRRRNAISLPTLHSVQGITRIQSTEDLDDDAETLIGDEEYDEEWEDSEDDLKNNKDKDEGMDKDNNDEGAPTGRNG
ncbi:hypothetical protein IWX46DRAFT_658153 [Phyllosticta citricarpa]|uniref:Uncharacterized protein n=1 Tax=Phyllosticta citricarpa TaxID=55181 RepID=A0ABR1MC78_9PEZI